MSEREPWSIAEERRKRDENIACAEGLLFGVAVVSPEYQASMIAANAHATIALIQDQIIGRAEALLRDSVSA